MAHHFAELNVGRLHHPIDDDRNAEFVEALGPINELAEASAGFVWRLTDESGLSSSYVTASDDPNFAINLSVWESIDALKEFVYRSDHTGYMKRRREWFEVPVGPFLVCWWVPAGHQPSVEEALDRLEKLAVEGPTAGAFTLANIYPAPDDLEATA